MFFVPKYIREAIHKIDIDADTEGVLVIGFKDDSGNMTVVQDPQKVPGIDYEQASMIQEWSHLINAQPNPTSASMTISECFVYWFSRPDYEKMTNFIEVVVERERRQNERTTISIPRDLNPMDMGDFVASKLMDPQSGPEWTTVGDYIDCNYCYRVAPDDMDRVSGDSGLFPVYSK